MIPRDLLQGADLTDYCFLHGYRGSIAHGTYEPNHEPNSIDDKDTMAFVVPGAEFYLGLQEYGSRGTKERQQDEWDIVLYEARKAISLLAQGNPNVLSILWLPENLYLKREPAGELLLANRDLFVGRHVYQPFIGYARGQFLKMTRASRSDNPFAGYMGEKRKRLVEKFGYDTKNAAHLIRLLRMGIEFLNDGEMYVQRQDAPELLAIKHGEWPLEKINEEAERLFKRAEDAYDRSVLPIRPDRERIEKLCMEIVATHAQDLSTWKEVLHVRAVH